MATTLNIQRIIRHVRQGRTPEPVSCTAMAACTQQAFDALVAANWTRVVEQRSGLPRHNWAQTGFSPRWDAAKYCGDYANGYQHGYATAVCYTVRLPAHALDGTVAKIKTMAIPVYGDRWLADGCDIEVRLSASEHARLRQRHTWFGCYVTGADHYLTPEDSVRILKLFDQADGATRGTPNRLLVRRAKIGALLNAIFQYNDMVEPAARMKYKLRPLAELREEWKQICFDSSNYYGGSAYAENPWTFGKWGQRTEAIVTNAPIAAAAVKPPAHSCVVIPAAKMTGGSKMTLQRDPAGFDFARIKVSLTNDVNDLWMNPSYGEAGHTVTADEAGEWYVFATVRVATTVPRDQAACYFGIYRQSMANGIALGRGEVADMPVAAWGGETGWRTLCLGRRKLCEGARVWVMNGILHRVDYVDVRDFTFVAPAIVERGVAAAGAN